MEEVKDKKKGGRPTSYKQEYEELAYNYCLMGAIDTELACFFDVDVSTINNWKKEHPKFFESIKKGKEIADATIARKLFDRAKGAVIQTQQAFKLKNVRYVDGNRVETEEIKIINLSQEQPPDTTAGIFWLKNRAPERWRDKQEIKADIEAKANITIVPMKGALQEFADTESDVNE